MPFVGNSDDPSASCIECLIYEICWGLTERRLVVSSKNLSFVKGEELCYMTLVLIARSVDSQAKIENVLVALIHGTQWVNNHCMRSHLDCIRRPEFR